METSHRCLLQSHGPQAHANIIVQVLLVMVLKLRVVAQAGTAAALVLLNIAFTRWQPRLGCAQTLALPPFLRPPALLCGSLLGMAPAIAFGASARGLGFESQG